MPPFRGGRGARGGRGGRGPSNGRLARSGIRTRAGYRRFDSQRVKDVDSSESENEQPNIEEVKADHDSGAEEDTEVIPPVRAYNTLLQSFKQPEQKVERDRKRRKLEVVEDVDEAAEDGKSETSASVAASEELEEEDEDEFINGEAEEDEDILDPFEVHFANPDDNELSRRLKDLQANEWRTEKQTTSTACDIVASAPRCVEGNIIRRPTIHSTTAMPLKKRLTSSAQEYLGSLDTIQQAISPYLCNYTDLLLANRTPGNAQSIRTLTCLHVLNHILKGRDKVLKNNTRLSQSQNQDLDLRDQGFTRPKVLILLETRQMSAKYADCIVQLFAPEQQENKQRFQSSFSSPIDDGATMPEDHRELFEGNNDNNFLTALKFTRKTLRFYAPFYTSDIILASPLGLCRVLENEDVKKRDHDFLSSIEIAIVDQADAMYMQNWTNVETVFRHLNLPLKESHGFDISRVRSWYLDGHAKFLRQTIMLAAYLTPEVNKLFNTGMLNIAGKAKFLPPSSIPSAISTIPSGIKQTFSRFTSSLPSSDPDARFTYFTTTALPALLRLPKPSDGAKGILIFIPSYYDFLRLRNFFATSPLTRDTSFGAIHEYTDVPAQRRARAHFLSGRHSFLLYTQRAHHFYRLRIRGVKRVVLYGTPDNPVFYEELVSGFLGTSLEDGRVGLEETGVRVLFSRWDGLALERIVGGGRVKGMLGGKGDVFEFV